MRPNLGVNPEGGAVLLGNHRFLTGAAGLTAQVGKAGIARPVTVELRSSLSSVSQPTGGGGSRPRPRPLPQR
jgi:hypothetical protein